MNSEIKLLITLTLSCVVATACAGDSASKVTAEATTSKGGAASGLTAFENSVIEPILSDLRAGIRPFNESGIGICKGSGKECGGYLGRDVGELPPGDYMMRAELAVPASGPADSWKVRFETECKTIRISADGKNKSESTNNRSKEYTVKYRSGDIGYRLSPLFKITSPNPSARQECSWKLVGTHPDGDKVYEGAWIVPQAK